MATILVVNLGSSSKKYALYSDSRLLLELVFEMTNTGFEMCSTTSVFQQKCESINKKNFEDTLQILYNNVTEVLNKVSVGKQIDSIVVRVVAPGSFFQKHEIINNVYINQLKQKAAAAPLHIPVLIREIESIQKIFSNIRIIAASDSAFHSTLPTRARNYSIDSEDTKKFDVYRFGYHGLSIASIVRRVHPVLGNDPERMVVCHIGGGTSVTAVLKGKSIETTMGFSPGTGLPMDSRAGDIDAAALLELMRVKHLKLTDTQLYLNTRGGLIGLAGNSDLRQLLDLRAQNNTKAKEALDIFTYNIQKAIASSSVALEGIDVIVLTATAAVRSVELREMILKPLAYLGVEIGEDRNQQVIGKDGLISARNSKIKVVVMRTDEMGEMAEIARRFS